MTMQVAMVGSDGWLIASDMCRTLMMPLRSGSLTTKIVIGKHSDLAYAFWGDDCAVLAGEKLEQRYSGMPQSDKNQLRHALVEFGNESWSKAKKSLASPPDPTLQRGLLIGFASSTYPLWDLRIGEDCSIAYDVPDKVCVGDPTNPALFFERYHSATLPIERLMQVAAHIILTGAYFNPYVAEFEMSVCKNGQFTTHWRGSDSLKQLTENSGELHAQIQKMILGGN
jgi:hypothetical protein